MNAHQILSRLEGVRARGGGRWMARCPAHQDRTPSLSIREQPDGRVQLYDFGGCSREAVLDALGVPRNEYQIEPASVEGAHAHAAGDVLQMLARESLVVMLAAEDLAAGMPLSPIDRERVLQAYARLRSAARAAHAL